MKKGFSLIELLVAIVILGALVSVVAQTFTSTQVKSRDNRRKSDLAGLVTALEAYYNDKGRYPNEGLSGQIAGCGSADSQICPWGGAFTDQYGTTYMQKLPIDPRSGSTYFYDVGGSNRSYQLYGRLENTKDNAVPKGAQGQPQAYGSTSCSSSAVVLCNYGVSSTNTTPENGHPLQ